jgi:hypothetical protein
VTACSGLLRRPSGEVELIELNSHYLFPRSCTIQIPICSHIVDPRYVKRAPGGLCDHELTTASGGRRKFTLLIAVDLAASMANYSQDLDKGNYSEEVLLATPFRFLDIPVEVRKIVYEEPFAGFQLIIAPPGSRHNANHMLYEANHMQYEVAQPIVPESAGNKLPPMLLTCKLLREESLPVFARSLSPEFYNCNYDDSARYQVPAHYLCEVRSVLSTGPVNGCSQPLNLVDMPKLEEVRYRCKNYFCTSRAFRTNLESLKNNLLGPSDTIVRLTLEEFEHPSERSRTATVLASSLKVLLLCTAYYYNWEDDEDPAYSRVGGLDRSALPNHTLTKARTLPSTTGLDK